jgi:hypothetical protein
MRCKAPASFFLQASGACATALRVMLTTLPRSADKDRRNSVDEAPACVGDSRLDAGKAV